MIRSSRRQFVYLLVLLLLNTLLTSAEDEAWTRCGPACSCKWVSGRKHASCENQTLDDVPPLNVPPENNEMLQQLILNNNRIRVLRDDVFRNLHLMNLQKLSLSNCKIEEIEKNAFRGLGIVIDLDLQSNEISELDSNTFRSTEKLRWLYLSRNKIQKIENGLFSNLTFLQILDLNDNEISYIGPEAFTGLPAMSSLNLSGNRLTHIKPSVFDGLGVLKSLLVMNNPWNCDCHLRDFFNWFMEKKLYTHSTECVQPAYLEHQSWSHINNKSLACKPSIVSLDSILDEKNERLYLTCKVVGNPKPETHLSFNGRILDSNATAESNGESKNTSVESISNEYRVNVTLHKVGRQDYGVYVCSAKNDAGLVETNTTFDGVTPSEALFPIPGGGDIWVLLLCLIIGILCTLVLIFMLCFLCCRRRVDKMAAKKPSSLTVTTNGDLTHHIIMEPEQQKTLLTAVNPVQKPPRKYDSSSPSDNCGTEMTELNRNLLDDCSVLGGANGSGDMMDDRRSNTSLGQLSSCNSQDNLLLGSERFRPVVQRVHPPDLLAFSSRRLQASPASSSVSNADLDATRFRTLHSPARSPIYHGVGHHPYTSPYDTLPHSRTHSPFSPTSSCGSTVPILSHRQGYVTIPRRPRVASWSRDVTTPTLDGTMTLSRVAAAQPTYDNLGPRTTADGSSVLSLPRRVSVESPVMRATRPQPPSPFYTSHTLPHKAKLNHVYLKLRDTDEPPQHFRPTTAAAAAAALKENNGVIRPLPLQFTPNGDVDPAKRSSWAPVASRATPETGVLKRAPSEMNGNGTGTPSPPLLSTTTTTTTTTTTPSTTPSTKNPKVPPKPPPKPKKSNGGPLFEDEGEDGTEV